MVVLNIVVIKIKNKLKKEFSRIKLQRAVAVSLVFSIIFFQFLIKADIRSNKENITEGNKIIFEILSDIVLRTSVDIPSKDIIFM